MRAVAGAEPAAEVACLADRYASQVCAHAEHDQPFGFLDAVGVFLGVAEDFETGTPELVISHGFDLGRSVSD